MPAGPGQHIYDEQSYAHDYHNNTSRDVTDLNGGGGPDESAASILQSVKEQVKDKSKIFKSVVAPFWLKENEIMI